MRNSDNSGWFPLSLDELRNSFGSLFLFRWMWMSNDINWSWFLVLQKNMPFCVYWSEIRIKKDFLTNQHSFIKQPTNDSQTNSCPASSGHCWDLAIIDQRVSNLIGCAVASLQAYWKKEISKGPHFRFIFSILFSSPASSYSCFVYTPHYLYRSNIDQLVTCKNMTSMRSRICIIE